VVVILSLCNSKFFFLSSHEQILGNSTNLSDFVVVDGWAGNFNRTGNSDEVDDSDGTGKHYLLQLLSQNCGN
jgi:hypothetical protein